MPKCRTFLFVLTADLGIPVEILKFLCADVSIAKGILMLMWGKPNAEASDIFLLDLTADLGIPREY